MAGAANQEKESPQSRPSVALRILVVNDIPLAEAVGRLRGEWAERTGGTFQTQSFFFRSSALFRSFKAIFDDFRQSYMLRYSPTGVDEKGWHAIAVEVPGVKGATVRARQGYFGS